MRPRPMKERGAPRPRRGLHSAGAGPGGRAAGPSLRKLKAGLGAGRGGAGAGGGARAGGGAPQPSANPTLVSQQLRQKSRRPRACDGVTAAESSPAGPQAGRRPPWDPACSLLGAPPRTETGARTHDELAHPQRRTLAATPTSVPGPRVNGGPRQVHVGDAARPGSGEGAEGPGAGAPKPHGHGRTRKDRGREAR